MQTIRHFTASVLIVFEDKVLLHWHKSLHKWLTIGGHMEPNETPEMAVIREAQEETGLEIELFRPQPLLGLSDAGELLIPMHMLLEDIEPHHQHMDFIFFATASNDSLHPAEGETDRLRWLTKDELLAMKDIPDNSRTCALQALQLLAKM